MTSVQRPVNNYKAYHAHVYFDQSTLASARALCTQAGKLFSLKVGRIHQQTIGPHTSWSCQITFGAKYFDTLIPWLDKNRNGLSVLVHPITGNDVLDHLDYTAWLGDPIEIDMAGLNP